MEKYQLKNSKIATIFAVLLALLMFFSMFLVFSNSSGTTADAQISEDTYGNVMQYEWPQFCGDGGATRFGAGPAPDTADILWKIKLGWSVIYPEAFDGKIFMRSGTPSNNQIYAIDPFTGDIIWKSPSIGSAGTLGVPGTICVEPHYLITWCSPVGAVCIDTNDGHIVWNVTGENAPFMASSDSIIYVPETKMFYARNYAYALFQTWIGGKPFGIQAWDCSDLSKPPVARWFKAMEGTTSPDFKYCYGDGRLYFGMPSGYVLCLNATTGEELWAVKETGNRMYGNTYYDGKLIQPGLDNNIFCHDGATGELLWRFNPGTFWGYWASGGAAAYGMFYELNADGHVYAIDMDTGKCVWKYGGAYAGNPYGPLDYYPGYTLVADGKVWQRTGTANARNQDTGEYNHDEVTCVDAFTGKLIWTLPISLGAGAHDGVMPAYGNLYVQPEYHILPENASRPYYGPTTPRSFKPNELWCLGSTISESTVGKTKPLSWPMFMRDPEHSSGGGVLPIGNGGPAQIQVKWKFNAN